MKNIFLTTIITIILLGTGCKEKSNSFEKRNILKNSDYQRMSNSQKNEFKNKIIADLKADSDFVFSYKLLSKQITIYSETKSVFKNLSEKKQLLSKINMVYKNHPELLKVDKITRREILKAASK
jgi:ribosomal protein S24E